MTRRMLGWALVLALGVAFSGLTTAARAADKNASGTWSWTINRNGEDIKTTLTLKQDGAKLTGKIKRASDGTETEIKEGKIGKDNELSFTVERERDGNKFVIKYSGKLDGNTIKGKTVMTIQGQERSRDWEAKRGD
jgi:hypothetical protein